MASSSALATAALPGIESTYAEHTRGVELARAGRHDEGLAVLQPLLARFPDDYALVRDVILINTWKGDCDAALEYFPRIRNHPRLDDYLIEPLADCAVRRARGGDFNRAIDVLSTLLPHVSDGYGLRRDIALITQWKGDCPGALARFDPIRDDARNPPYLLAPMADCLLRADRRLEALALLDAGLARYPADPLLTHARAKADIALRLDGNLYDERPALDVRFVSADSDRDLREWRLEAEGSANLAETWRVYGRYLRSGTGAAQFESGKMNRVGAGVRWRPTAELLIDQGVSTDLDQSHRGGAHTRIVYRPYDPWKMALGRDSYAEDISVRARANDIEARRSFVDVEYSSLDHVWYWYGIASQYRFSDGNRRRQFLTTVGYAYAMLPGREHRIYLEWYGSRNTLPTAPYFNPVRDRNVALVHSTEFVFDSRFKRHVDRLYLALGAYTQEGFERETVWGVSYEQVYDFDSANSLTAGAGLERNFYDGQREDEWRVFLRYGRRF